MKKLKIQYVEALNKSDAQSASDVLENIKEFNAIDVVNWPTEYSYRPESIFYIARSSDSLFIKFKVTETNLRAIYSTDQDPVYEDSCVEFFCKMPDRNSYMNFEFNCIGTCIATTRKGRDIEVVPFSSGQLEKIQRFSSLGHQTFSQKEGFFNWELTVKIPFIILGIDPNNLPEKLLGNFYKCADGTTSPHFVSWSSISTETPDFHRPEYFGKLNI